MPKHRTDPYQNYRFLVKFDGRAVAGVSKVSALTRSTQVVTYRAGGDPTTPRPSPGQSKYAAITLERGITQDLAFEQWANKVWDYQNVAGGSQAGTPGQVVSIQDFRKDIILELYNEAGQLVMAYTIHRCWVSEFNAIPELDSSGNAIAISSLKLENEGWERNTSIPEPAEPEFTLPATD